MKTCFTTHMKTISLACKAIKSTVIYFENTVAIGFNDNIEISTGNHVIKVVEGMFGLSGFYNVKDIQLIEKMMKASKLDCFVDEYGTVTVGDDTEFPMYRLNMMKYGYDEMYNKLMTIGNINVKTPVITKSMEEIPMFETYMALASSSPAITTWIDDNKEYYITMIPKMLPVNKGDTVTIRIYNDDKFKDEYGRDLSFITRYTVIKNKINLDVYIRYIKIYS